jgi:hypothetical protein
MGHNGGFNPYRDANGEYATPQQAGKPGRKRGGGARAGTVSGSTQARPPLVGTGKRRASFTSFVDTPAGVALRGPRPISTPNYALPKTQLHTPAKGAKKAASAPKTRDELLTNFRHPTGSRSAVKAARLFLGDSKSSPKQLYQKLQAWEGARMKAGRKNDREEQVMAGISQVMANTLDV